MQHIRLDEALIGIKISGRNIHNLRCTDDTTLIAESEEELSRLLMKLKEEGEKAEKLNLHKTKIMAPVRLFHGNCRRKSGNTERLYFLGSKITADGDYSKRHLLLGKKAMTKAGSVLKSINITLLTGSSSQSYGFSSSHVWM